MSSVTVEVSDEVTGQLWTVDQINELSKLLAMISLGQAEHAAEIIETLSPIHAVPSHTNVYLTAREQLQISGTSQNQRNSSRFRRDGFLFECMSWIVTRQTIGKTAYMKEPHVRSTDHGLDGLIIQMNPQNTFLEHTIICEDKCTDHPRDKFRSEVMTTFTDFHQNIRGAELLANAVALIRQTGLKGTAATLAAEKVYDKTSRTYLAALTVDSTICTPKKRKKLFEGYEELPGLSKEQRIGATFIVTDNLRDWFQSLADSAIQVLNEFEARETSHV